MSLINLLRQYRTNSKKKTLLNNIIKTTPENLLKNDIFLKNDISKCFASNKVGTINSNAINRIIKAYKKAKSIQENKSIEYQVGNEWLPLYKKYMSEIIAALMNEDQTKINAIYENFMREDCSVGLHGMPTDMKKAYFGEKIYTIDKDLYLYDAIYRYLHWKELTNASFNENDLAMPLFGNTYGFYVNDVFIRTGAEYLHYYANEIDQLTKDKTNKKIIAELGGGYGGLAYFINKKISNVTYIDFDLPENLALTSYYLLNSFPEKKVLLFGEEDLAITDITNYDIILMPNFEITKLPTSKIDVVFNSYSLAEMSKETIDLYISELTRASKEYFFHVNHNKISHSYIADEFGIDAKGFKLIYKKPALWNLGRNNNMDEFEYLYRKSN
jgi:hypothetical protein